MPETYSEEIELLTYDEAVALLPDGDRVHTLGERLRWKLWGLLTRSRRVCPVNAHSALIWRMRPLRESFVDRECRTDCAANGGCWCGNLDGTGQARRA